MNMLTRWSATVVAATMPITSSFPGQSKAVAFTVPVIALIHIEKETL
jgi:hypothetical protein